MDGDTDVDVLCASNPGSTVTLFDNDANFSEADGDGVRDDLDCAPGDASTFAAPREVPNVGFTSVSQLRWGPAAPSAGAGTVHDVMRGSLAELRTGSASGEACLADGTPATGLADTSAPPTGAGFYYLVRGSNACGVGSWGFGSSGIQRSSAICP